MKSLQSPLLLAEDGAKFYAEIKSTPDDKFQVACYARLDKGSSVIEELPINGVFNSKQEAKAWAHQQAVGRRFDKLSLEDKDLVES